ncbi:hypothetical protein ACFWPQ_20150 [Streptomyces sp. NPDC058464]|uniref:hypothetical protein n=1 Tax=Streptomyces sp. NPDC058464 TaxID=3346511 RepID=UPI00365B5383
MVAAAGDRVQRTVPADWFDRSHLDALATRRLLTRIGSTELLASYSSIALVSLVPDDLARASRYLRDTLGDLEAADLRTRDVVLAFNVPQPRATAR